MGYGDSEGRQSVREWDEVARKRTPPGGVPPDATRPMQGDTDLDPGRHDSHRQEWLCHAMLDGRGRVCGPRGSWIWGTLPPGVAVPHMPCYCGVDESSDTGAGCGACVALGSCFDSGGDWRVRACGVCGDVLRAARAQRWRAHFRSALPSQRHAAAYLQRNSSRAHRFWICVAATAYDPRCGYETF